MSKSEVEATKPKTQTKKVVNLLEFQHKSLPELIKIAKAYNIDNCSRKKEELIFTILKACSRKGESIYGGGLLEVLPDNYGFLRNPLTCEPGPADIYVSQSQIRKFGLKTGDTISGYIRPPKDSEKYFALLKTDNINFSSPEANRNKTLFDNLTPIFPNEKLDLERKDGSTEDITTRLINIAAPIGKGQRGLIVSPPKAGKTVILQNIAQSITKNNPECKLIVLLIDERPEEVTEMARSVKGEVIASTFDKPASRHIQIVEMVMEKAKRLVENKYDVVILLDSITRLARAYNTVVPSSGKVLTGGVDAHSLHRPKRVFGAARNVEEGGSLTILATCLVETGSKMDEVIFEEFKGTGNMELRLERKIAETRTYPAIDFKRSSTRRSELIIPAEELRKVWILHKLMYSMNEKEAIDFMLERLKNTKTNAEFFESMRQ